MRPHIHKKVSWDSPLSVAEKNHLKNDAWVHSKQDLIERIDWERKYTNACPICEAILTKLEEIQK